MSAPAEGARRDHLLAAAWGCAEATLFFIVPDVLLSWLVLARPRRARRSTRCRASRPSSSPTSTPTSRAAASTPSSSAPCAECPTSSTPPPGASRAARWPRSSSPASRRLLRFLAVTLLALALRRTLCARLSLRAVRALHALAWAAFYAWYFAVMES